MKDMGRTTTCPHCGKTFERQPKSAAPHYQRDQKRKQRAKMSAKGKLRGLNNQSKWRWPVSADDLSEYIVDE